MLETMMKYENGELTEVEEIKMFSELVSSGLAWKLQGFYGRAAARVIEAGIIDRNGMILVDLNLFEG